MTRFRNFAIAAALMFGLAISHAATLYGAQYAGSTPIYTLNQTTGALTAGPATGVDNIGDLASSGTDSSIWGVQISTNTLYTFNALTGATLSSVAITGSDAPTGESEKIVSIAYDAKGKVLYGNAALTLGGGSDLFKIDVFTGAATWIGNLQVDPIYALAFDSVGGYLYGASGEASDQSYLWKIDPFSAAAFSVGALRTTGNFDLAFRPGDNALFMASSGSSSLYTVDLTNAMTTLVGPYGSGTNVAGLAFAVPEPQTYALMFVGLCLVGWATRHRG